MTIEEATNRYGRVYVVSIEDVEYIYRPLTVGEYRKFFIKSEDDAIFEEKVIATCVITPNIDLAAVSGRLPTTLSGCILESSLLDSDENMEAYVASRVDLYKKTRSNEGAIRMADSLGAIMIAVTQAFPSTDPIMLDKLTPEELLDLYAMSIFKLGGIEEEKAPRNMPMGLTPGEQQQFKEQAAAQNSMTELKKQWEEEKRKAMGK